MADSPCEERAQGASGSARRVKVATTRFILLVGPSSVGPFTFTA